MKRLSVAVFAALLFALPATSYGDDVLTVQTGDRTITVNQNDLRQLLNALHTALSPADNKVMVALKKPSEMPSYAPDWYYAGLTPGSNGAGPAITVWVRDDLKGDIAESAMAKSFMLGLMDGNYAGTDMKQLYDAYAKLDAAQGPNAPNPFVNRQKLADALQKALLQ